MEKLTFEDDVWLKEKELVPGCLYIIKDGRVMLYLGIDLDNCFIFYNCGSLNFANTNWHTHTIANYEVQVKYMLDMCNSLLNRPIYKESIVRLKGIPKIYCLFPFIDFKTSYVNWYTKSLLMYGELPKLSELNKNIPIKGFVGAKELIPGNLYYSGQCWRSTYVYLGRTTDNYFVWCFVGNAKTLIENKCVDLLTYRKLEMVSTKTNKKVKPLVMALSDKDAYVCEETKQLIDMDFKLNMDGVTQQMLDRIL